MNITLSGKGSSGKNVKIMIPEMPERIQFSAGTIFREYNILDKGPIKIPYGRDLETISWEARLPGEVKKNEQWLCGKKWRKPEEINKIIRYWQKTKKRIQVNVTKNPINMKMYIDQYSYDLAGGFGDYEYSISFVRAGALVVAKKAVPKRLPKEEIKNQKYTVKSGDCLWSIAQKKYKNGSGWTKIYNANKGVIEKEAKKRGKKSSQNGHWIFPGMVLKIP